LKGQRGKSAVHAKAERAEIACFQRIAAVRHGRKCRVGTPLSFAALWMLPIGAANPGKE